MLRNKEEFVHFRCPLFFWYNYLPEKKTKLWSHTIKWSVTTFSFHGDMNYCCVNWFLHNLYPSWSKSLEVFANRSLLSLYDKEIVKFWHNRVYVDTISWKCGFKLHLSPYRSGKTRGWVLWLTCEGCCGDPPSCVTLPQTSFFFFFMFFFNVFPTI